MGGYGVVDLGVGVGVGVGVGAGNKQVDSTHWIQGGKGVEQAKH